MTKRNRNRKQNLDRVKSKQSEYDLWFKSLIVEQHLKSRISNLKATISECNKQSDKELFGESLRKAEYAKKILDDSIEFLDLHGFLYRSTIDRLVDAVEDFQKHHELSRKRALEIMIETGEEIDFEIPSDLKLEEI